MSNEGTVTVEFPCGKFICELPDVGEPEKWRLLNGLWGEPIAVHPNHEPIILTPFIDAAESK